MDVYMLLYQPFKLWLLLSADLFGSCPCLVIVKVHVYMLLYQPFKLWWLLSKLFIWSVFLSGPCHGTCNILLYHPSSSGGYLALIVFAHNLVWSLLRNMYICYCIKHLKLWWFLSTDPFGPCPCQVLVKVHVYMLLCQPFKLWWLLSTDLFGPCPCLVLVKVHVNLLLC